MKKFLVMVCSAALLLSLAGCGNANSKSDTSDDARKESTSITQATNTSASQNQSTTNTQPDEEVPPAVEEWKPQFESERLTVYADQFHDDEIKDIHTEMFGGFYVELEDGLYGSDDAEKNNLFDESTMASWSYSEFTDFICVDHDGYYHIAYKGKEYLAHGINGDIFYCFADMMSGDMVVYSLDKDGYVYCNQFEDTGKKVKDNEKIVFEVTVNGNDIVYDQVDSLLVLPAKGNYISAPYILVYLDGIGYVQNFSFVFRNSFTVSNRAYLASNETYMDHSNSTTMFDYVTEGVDDKISYIHNNDQYVVNLPDGHIVDEIKYFNRGIQSTSYYGGSNMSNYDILVFENGDVYFWDDDPSILGEDPIKDEELSQIGSEIQEVIFSNTDGYYFLMSDGVFYEVNEQE